MLNLKQVPKRFIKHLEKPRGRECFSEYYFGILCEFTANFNARNNAQIISKSTAGIEEEVIWVEE